ncbi:phosphoribosylamine--glycine ligase [Pelagibacteraceae bacterium]|nr:phosphoribosylamine--glycine ligase [Pelagibacteraceae bacterium]
MNIALIGSGGREHALCSQIAKSSKVNKIYCVPGNAGTLNDAVNIDIDFLNFNLLYKIIRKYKISLVIIGPEEPLVNGLVDFLKRKKIKVFGPSKYASKLEGSKAFMKSLCKRNKIPTAQFKVCNNKTDVSKFLKKVKMPLVVKADGLAGGKGVSICFSPLEVKKICDAIFKGKFKSSNKVILEEFLKGEEASYFVVVDQKSFSFMGSAQDHKRVGEGETGPNTGGMGAYSPAPIITKKLEKKIIDKIIKPTLLDLKKSGNPFTGFLYAGLMIKDNEPFLIEYNIRMGDPECQVIIPRLKTNVLDIILASLNNKLKNIKIKWKKEKCMTVVMCSKGYPKKYKTKIKIKNLDKVKFNKNSIIFHAGTAILDNHLVSSGGRVLNIACVGHNFLKIKKNIYKILKKINWQSGFFRKDIGWRII